jgi:hypothetical protein
MARSHILSLDRYPDGTDRKRYSRELDLIAARLRAGEPLALDDAEVDRVSRLVRQVQEETWWDNLKLFARAMWWLAPLWAIIALAVILFFWN